MNNEYWHSEQLVDLLHEIFGFHPGWRAVHGLGRMYAGTFTATPEAKHYTRAVHMQGDPIPVTARFSYSFPDRPNMPAAAQSAMATKFYLPRRPGDGPYRAQQDALPVPYARRGVGPHKLLA